MACERGEGEGSQGGCERWFVPVPESTCAGDGSPRPAPQSLPSITAGTDSPALAQPGRKTKFKSTGLLPGMVGCHHPPASTPGAATWYSRHRRGSPRSPLRDKPPGTERGERWLWRGSGLRGFAIRTADFPASGFSVKRCDFLLVKQDAH